jgi:hypothetical protein
MVPVLVRTSDVGRRDSLGLERAATKVWLQNVITVRKNVEFSTDIQQHILFATGPGSDSFHRELVIPLTC